MKLREWTLEGTARRNGQPIKLLTSPEAGREVAYKKMLFRMRGTPTFGLHLRRGGIVER